MAWRRQISIGLVLSLCTLGTVTLPAVAENPVVEMAAEPAQFYVLSFTDQPIDEVAEAVIGGALSQTASVDPAIDDVMSFQAEGSFTPDGLLADFGEALLDRDVALVRSRQGDLSLVLRANLGSELAKGAVLVASSAPVKPIDPPMAKSSVVAPITYGRDRWQDGPLGALLVFLAGALSGAFALRGSQIMRARTVGAVRPARLLITREPPNPEHHVPAEDAELVIPRFKPSKPL